MSEYIVDLSEVEKTSDRFKMLFGESILLGEPIVRCRDCRYMGYGTWGGERPMVCKRRIRAYQVQPDGFCSWASRREGAES